MHGLRCRPTSLWRLHEPSPFFQPVPCHRGNVIHIIWPMLLGSNTLVEKKWNDTHFERSSLRETGYVLQLGHHPSDWCTNPQRSPKTFTVVHTNGVHLVDLAFCGCDKAGDHGTRVQQLLRRRLFPATSTDPQTACTIPFLKSAQLLSLQSKLSLYDYYLCIEQLTDATGTADANVGRLFQDFF